MPHPTRAAGLVCGEVRGGNESTWTVVDLPGLAGVLYSSPCHGDCGGDVHYCSMCNSGIIARVCLADVAGHGERVAGVARVMHAELRASVNSWDEREVMRALDVRLDRSGIGALTTAALLSYRPRRRQLTISYAGHPPGWFYRPASEGSADDHAGLGRWTRLTIDDQGPGGPCDLPLGSGLGPNYTRARLAVRPGDRVLLVTDGVLEAPAPDETEFGDAGVEGVLREAAANGGSCEAIARALLEALRVHTGRDPMEHDDVSFYVAEILPTPVGGELWLAVKNRLLAPILGRAPQA